MGIITARVWKTGHGAVKKSRQILPRRQKELMAGKNRFRRYLFKKGRIHSPESLFESVCRKGHRKEFYG